MVLDETKYAPWYCYQRDNVILYVAAIHLSLTNCLNGWQEAAKEHSKHCEKGVLRW
jgi:hypothetical protein